MFCLNQCSAGRYHGHPRRRGPRRHDRPLPSSARNRIRHDQQRLRDHRGRRRLGHHDPRM